MASIDYTKGMLHTEFTKRVLTAAGPEILKEQRNAVTIKYSRRTGNITDSLSNDILSIGPYAGGIRLAIAYTTGIRFLDMRKTASGAKKKVYAPVYNKQLFGYVYGVIYPQLRYGLNKSIETEILDELKQSYNDF